jgi:hypothetical protein
MPWFTAALASVSTQIRSPLAGVNSPSIGAASSCSAQSPGLPSVLVSFATASW